jgi:hypothetical protein
MEALDYWRLCEALSVSQAALLIVGVDPSVIQERVDHSHDSPHGYDAARTALINAIEGGRLRATNAEVDVLVPSATDDWLEPPDSVTVPDWNNTKIKVEDLRTWLRSRGINTGFFFPEPEIGPVYLCGTHPNYAPKLAAAVEAWTAVVADPELRRGKSVKQALVIWLRQHAHDYELTKDDGNPNEQAIDEIAKIANWDMKGGAPKTPGNA